MSTTASNIVTIVGHSAELVLNIFISRPHMHIPLTVADCGPSTISHSHNAFVQKMACSGVTRISIVFC